jgi:uncharacterized membrane protein HdeD (DUF308 family)
MLTSITRNWWIFLIRGICAVIIGIVAFAWPGITLEALVLVFGIYAIIDGVSAIAIGASADSVGERWWGMVLVGVLSLIAGILTFAWPAITAVVLLAFIAAWAIVRGIMEIYAAITLRKMIENEWMLVLGGICSILFGGIMVARPAAGALAVLWIIGIYAIVFGVLTIALAFKLHSLRPHLPHDTAGLTAPSN